MAKTLGVDLGTSGGQWLFRQEGLVLGPVPGTKLVEMLYHGEIDGQTEVAPMGTPNFKRLSEVEFFRVHYAKSEAKRRVDQSAVADQKDQAKKRNLKVVGITVVMVVLAAGAAFGARYLAIHNPWKNADEMVFEDISVEPPTITVASARWSDEELIDYPGRTSTRPVVAAKSGSATTPGSTALPPGPTGSKTTGALASAGTAGAQTPPNPMLPPKTEKTTKSGPGGKAKTVAAATTGKVPKMSDASEDPDGMQMAQFDQAAINAVVGSKQKSLYPCFIEEAKRTPGLAERIPLEFVIGNDGRVAKLWVDNPKFKTGPLYECLLRELKKWPFKPYEGERATVNLSFNIGKKR